MSKPPLRSGTLNDIRVNNDGTGSLYTPDGVLLPLDASGVVSTPVTVIQTIQGQQGNQGSKGTDGRTILGDGRDPLFINDGVIGDFFINTNTLTIFGPKTQEGWGDGMSLRGNKGDRGVPGPAGTNILHGVVSPTVDDGMIGDFFIDSAASVLWGPKQSDNTWSANDQVSLRGRQGVKGDAGADGHDGLDGADGRTILSGSGSPNLLSIGKVGDFYLDTDSMVIFGPKSLTTGWGGVGVPLKGPQGDRGIQGLKGDPGELSGTLTTDRVIYHGTTTLSSILDTLLYVVPVLSGFSGNTSEAEVGQSIASEIFSWTISKSVTSQTFNGTSIDPNVRTKTVTGPFTTNTTWTLSASDGTTTIGQSYTLTFKYRRFWGTSASSTLTDSQILALSNELSTARGKLVSYDASGGKYVYYCYPASFGTVTASVGGLAFSDFTTTTRNVVTGTGATVSYNIVRFNGIQTGSAIQVIWS